MEILLDKRESDRKCLNHARVHASAQSFDRCEVKFLISELPPRELEKVPRESWKRSWGEVVPVSCFQNGGPVERSLNCSETSQVTW